MSGKEGEIVLTPSQAAEYKAALIQARLQAEQAQLYWELAVAELARARVIIEKAIGGGNENRA